MCTSCRRLHTPLPQSGKAKQWLRKSHDSPSCAVDTTGLRSTSRSTRSRYSSRKLRRNWTKHARRCPTSTRRSCGSRESSRTRSANCGRTTGRATEASDRASNAFSARRRSRPWTSWPRPMRTHGPSSRAPRPRPPSWPPPPSPKPRRRSPRRAPQPNSSATIHAKRRMRCPRMPSTRRKSSSPRPSARPTASGRWRPTSPPRSARRPPTRSST